jgi:type I restriction enzyme R subunit
MSAAQFLESLFGMLPEFFKDEGQLRELWSDPATRKALLAGLADKGFGREALAEMQKAIEAENSDLFDVLAYVAYTRPPITREERAVFAKAGINTSYRNNRQLAFLDFVLSHYVDQGVDELDLDKLSQLLRLKYHAVADATAELGTPEQIRNVFIVFQKYLYQDQVD